MPLSEIALPRELNNKVVRDLYKAAAAVNQCSVHLLCESPEKSGKVKKIVLAA